MDMMNVVMRNLTAFGRVWQRLGAENWFEILSYTTDPSRITKSGMSSLVRGKSELPCMPLVQAIAIALFLTTTIHISHSLFCKAKSNEVLSFCKYTSYYHMSYFRYCVAFLYWFTRQNALEYLMFDSVILFCASELTVSAQKIRKDGTENQNTSICPLTQLVVSLVIVFTAITAYVIYSGTIWTIHHLLMFGAFRDVPLAISLIVKHTNAICCTRRKPRCAALIVELVLKLLLTSIFNLTILRIYLNDSFQHINVLTLVQDSIRRGLMVESCKRVIKQVTKLKKVLKQWKQIDHILHEVSYHRLYQSYCNQESCMLCLEPLCESLSDRYDGIEPFILGADYTYSDDSGGSVMELRCGHVGHADCLESLILSDLHAALKCPICRADLMGSSLRRYSLVSRDRSTLVPDNRTRRQQSTGTRQADTMHSISAGVRRIIEHERSGDPQVESAAASEQHDGHEHGLASVPSQPPTLIERDQSDANADATTAWSHHRRVRASQLYGDDDNSSSFGLMRDNLDLITGNFIADFVSNGGMYAVSKAFIGLCYLLLLICMLIFGASLVIFLMSIPGLPPTIALIGVHLPLVFDDEVLTVYPSLRRF